MSKFSVSYNVVLDNYLYLCSRLLRIMRARGIFIEFLIIYMHELHR